MSYTNFAYYFRPHGWYPQHNPLRFAASRACSGQFGTVASAYLRRRTIDELIRPLNELNALRIASRHWSPNSQFKRIAIRALTPAMSINHMRDGDTCYYDDELAASCGL